MKKTKMKICACITEKTEADFLKAVKGIKADLIEHRIDYLYSGNNKRKKENKKQNIETKKINLKKLYQKVKLPIIATNRSVKCGGFFKGSEEKRVEMLLDAINAGASFVDIEMETKLDLRQKIISKARKRKCKIIISYHNYKKTSSKKELAEVMKEQKMMGADIGKIVTYANSKEDNKTITKLFSYAKEEKFSLIAFAMGRIGKETRVSCLIYGAPFTYASVNRKSAPGQINVTEMNKIIDKLL